MKVLYVDLQYEYGMKNRGVNQIGEYGFRKVFERLGHSVECFYYDDYLKNTGALQQDLLKAAAVAKPDLIFFNLFGEQFSLETISELTSKYRTMNWFGDDQWRFESFTKKYAPEFTYSVTTDPFAVDKYHALGVRNVFLSQWAALEFDAEPEWVQTPNYKYDVSFVGGSHSVRRWFIKELGRRGIEVATFGYGWPSGPIPLQKMIELFQITKINLNLSNSTTFDIRYLMDNIKNPVVLWKSPKSESQLKARNFEIPYYGGFQMTDYVPFIENYLEVGREISCYRDVAEAALLIEYYLKNDELREKIRLAGMRRSQTEHTYTHRLKLILESL